jgi:hypothetical protein
MSQVKHDSRGILSPHVGRAFGMSLLNVLKELSGSELVLHCGRSATDQQAFVPRLVARGLLDGIASLSFMIEFLVRETDQSGSFWPNALIARQLCDNTCRNLVGDLDDARRC